MLKDEAVAPQQRFVMVSDLLISVSVICEFSAIRAWISHIWPH